MSSTTNTEDDAAASARRAHQHQQNRLVDTAAEVNNVGIRLFLSGSNFEAAAEAFGAAHCHFSAALSNTSTTGEVNNGAARESSTSSMRATATQSTTMSTTAPASAPSCDATSTSSNSNIMSSQHSATHHQHAPWWPLPSSGIFASPVRIDPEATKRRTRRKSDHSLQTQSQSQSSSSGRGATVACYDRELSAVLFNLALCHHALGYQHYNTYRHALSSSSSYLVTEHDEAATAMASSSATNASSASAISTASHFGAAHSLYSQCNTFASRCGYRGNALVAIVKAALGNSAQIRACVMGDGDGAQELLEEMEAVHDITERLGPQEQGEESLSFVGTVSGGGATRSSRQVTTVGMAPSA